MLFLGEDETWQLAGIYPHISIKGRDPQRPLLRHDDTLPLPLNCRTVPRMEVASPEAAALELIRNHCDNGIRYYTWALKRMPTIPEQANHVPLAENLRSALAQVLAYVEGASNERGAMLMRNEIVARYTKVVEDEGWEPPFITDPSSG